MKRENYLLIIFFIALGIYFYKFNTTNSMNSETNIHANTNQNVHVNNLIINENDKLTYSIPINEPIELDFLSKQKVFDTRKKYTDRASLFISSDYEPSAEVFGQIEDGKPWWGFKGATYRGAGEYSIEGLSEESRFINNPLLLMGVNEGGGRIFKKEEEPDIYVKPISLFFQPNSKSIIAKYDILGYYRDKGLLLDDNTYTEGPPNEGLTFECINARDFGYNYAYAYSFQNISFSQSGNNLSTDVQRLQDFIHTGNSCGYPGGCNNASPRQDFLNFTAPIAFPAQIGIRLWKEKPQDKNTPADLYYIVNFQ